MPMPPMIVTMAAMPMVTAMTMTSMAMTAMIMTLAVSAMTMTMTITAVIMTVIAMTMKFMTATVMRKGIRIIPMAARVARVRILAMEVAIAPLSDVDEAIIYTVRIAIMTLNAACATATIRLLLRTARQCSNEKVLASRCFGRCRCRRKCHH